MSDHDQNIIPFLCFKKITVMGYGPYNCSQVLLSQFIISYLLLIGQQCKKSEMLATENQKKETETYIFPYCNDKKRFCVMFK